MKVTVVIEGIDSQDIYVKAFKNRHSAAIYFEKAKKTVLMQEVTVLDDQGNEAQDEIKALKCQVAKAMTVHAENEELKKQLANETSINDSLIEELAKFKK
jgi:hypothetical protein